MHGGMGYCQACRPILPRIATMAIALYGRVWPSKAFTPVRAVLI